MEAQWLSGRMPDSRVERTPSRIPYTLAPLMALLRHDKNKIIVLVICSLFFCTFLFPLITSLHSQKRTNSHYGVAIPPVPATKVGIHQTSRLVVPPDGVHVQGTSVLVCLWASRPVPPISSTASYVAVLCAYCYFPEAWRLSGKSA